MRMYDDDNKEAQSIIAWTERRLKHSDVGMFRMYIDQFKSMWVESFGTLESVPQEFKDQVERQLSELKQIETNKVGGY